MYAESHLHKYNNMPVTLDGIAHCVNFCCNLNIYINMMQLSCFSMYSTYYATQNLFNWGYTTNKGKAIERMKCV